MYRRRLTVYRIPPLIPPPILLLLINNQIRPRIIHRPIEPAAILVLNELLGDLLLDDLTAPVVLEPRLGDDLGSSAREQQGVLLAGDVEVDLRSPGKQISSGIEGSHVPCS